MLQAFQHTYLKIIKQILCSGRFPLSNSTLSLWLFLYMYVNTVFDVVACDQQDSCRIEINCKLGNYRSLPKPCSLCKHARAKHICYWKYGNRTHQSHIWASISILSKLTCSHCMALHRKWFILNQFHMHCF